MNLNTENQLTCLAASPLWQRGDKRGVVLERGSEEEFVTDVFPCT